MTRNGGYRWFKRNKEYTTTGKKKHNVKTKTSFQQYNVLRYLDTTTRTVHCFGSISMVHYYGGRVT